MADISLSAHLTACSDTEAGAGVGLSFAVTMRREGPSNLGWGKPVPPPPSDVVILRPVRRP